MGTRPSADGLGRAVENQTQPRWCRAAAGSPAHGGEGVLSGAMQKSIAVRPEVVSDGRLGECPSPLALIPRAGIRKTGTASSSAVPSL